MSVFTGKPRDYAPHIIEQVIQDKAISLAREIGEPVFTVNGDNLGLCLPRGYGVDPWE